MFTDVALLLEVASSGPRECALSRETRTLKNLLLRLEVTLGASGDCVFGIELIGCFEMPNRLFCE